jgi:hypothetical protein
MAEKRKKRGKKFIPKPMERPKALDQVPKADVWEKTVSTDDQVQTVQKAEEESRAKAASLVDLQRKSVQVLTHTRTQVENLPVDQILDAINGGKFVVFDNLLGEDLGREMMEEAQSMFDNNKLELDLNAGITSGEYGAAIMGGKEQYIDCPRSVEYVVSTTRHLAGMLNKAGDGEDGNALPNKLDETASLAGLKLFDRKARVSSLALLTGNEGDDTVSLEKKPFGCLVDKNSDVVDMRKVTAIYYMTPKDWDVGCGGGVTFKDVDGVEKTIEAKNDRLLLFNSEESVHRLEPWIGKDRIEGTSGYIIAHLLRTRR